MKDGSLTVDDARTGKRWTFENISLSLERPHGGGVVVTVGSDNPDHPWGLTASINPTRDGYRSIALEARQVSANDLLLASRLGDGSLQINLPLSASLRGEIGPNGVPQSLTGRIVADAGSINDANDSDGRLDIDHAEFKIDWDAASRMLSVPFQILSGGNRITLLGQVEAPAAAPGPWLFKIGGGTVVLAAPSGAGDPLILNRVVMSGQFDPVKKRFVVDQGDLGNTDVGVAMSGTADYSSGDLHLATGVAVTRMPADALKRLWPVFVSPKVRDWFNDHLTSGNVDHVTIARKCSAQHAQSERSADPRRRTCRSTRWRPIASSSRWRACRRCTTPISASTSSGATRRLRSARRLPICRPAASSCCRPACSKCPTRRRMSRRRACISSSTGRFRPPPSCWPWTACATPPACRSIRRRRTAHLSALVALAMPLKSDLPPGSTNYAITVDATNFSAEHMIMGQKVEAAALKVSANNQGFALKGDVKIGGAPASLEYRKLRGDDAADVHIQGMLDETMRNNLGLDPANSISGSIPIDVTGRVGTTSDRDGRFSVTADLTPAQIDGFLPGWVKQAGKPARATFTLTTKPQSIRIDDLLIEGAGGGVKGAIELDGSGDAAIGQFPVLRLLGRRSHQPQDRPHRGRRAARRHARRRL